MLPAHVVQRGMKPSKIAPSLNDITTECFSGQTSSLSTMSCCQPTKHSLLLLESQPLVSQWAIQNQMMVGPSRTLTFILTTAWPWLCRQLPTPANQSALYGNIHDVIQEEVTIGNYNTLSLHNFSIVLQLALSRSLQTEQNEGVCSLVRAVIYWPIREGNNDSLIKHFFHSNWWRHHVWENWFWLNIFMAYKISLKLIYSTALIYINI